MTVERNSSREAEWFVRQFGVWIADRLIPENLPTFVVPAKVLWVGPPTLVLASLVLEQTYQAATRTNNEWHIQTFLCTMLIALTNNVDNLGARIAYSIQGTRVSTIINLWISIITFVVSFAAATFGAEAIGYLGARGASMLAMGFLVAIGAWMILQARKPGWREQEPSTGGAANLLTILLKPTGADLDKSRHIDFNEGTVLGIALSINNIGGGLSGGIIGANPFLVALLSAVVSFSALWAGNYMAEVFVRRNITAKAAIVGGALLIAIGIKQVL